MTPETAAPSVQSVHSAHSERPAERPVFSCTVQAGFPSPADDYIEGMLDLNTHLVKNPVSTFFIRVSGDSMIGAGIASGDLLVVDRSLAPESGNVVIAVLNGELTVKRLWREGGRVELRPENPAYAPIRLTGAMELDVWGVVRHVVHSV